MKFYNIFLVIIALIACCGQLFGQKMNSYAVEVGAFAERIQLNYFSKMNNFAVYEVLDMNEIYRYWIDTKDKESAHTLKQQAIQNGFINARVIDFAAMKEACNATCGYTPPKITKRSSRPENIDLVANRAYRSKGEEDNRNIGLVGPNYKIPTDNDFERADNKNNAINKSDKIGTTDFYDPKKEKISCLFYDYDSPNLRIASKKELDKVASLLLQNKQYKVNIHAHTDAHGSDSYNDRLSAARARIAHRYLNWRGIEDDQIQNGPYGERKPIALNQLKNGQDTPVGRQLNRRVELVIFDKNGKKMDLVNPIEVPDKCKIGE